MAVNRKWVKTDGAALTYAPTWLGTDAGLVVNPSEEQYRAAGWMANAVTPPSPPEGMMVAATRYEIVCEAGKYSVVAVYEYAPVPVAPKRYSKMKFVLALAKRGMLAEWDEFASKTEVMPGLTVCRLFSEATWLQSNDDNFGEVLKAADHIFGTDTINAALDESEDEEW